MCGSGVVLREAVQQGHEAIGFDVDPLAVLMSQVWTRSLDSSRLLERSEAIIEKAAHIRDSDISLPWIDEDKETAGYIDFWYKSPQKDELRRLAYLVARRPGPVNHALQLAISRLIITKRAGASLAWDVSHSRPHKMKVENDFDVVSGFRTAVSLIAEEISRIPAGSNATVRIGNARRLGRLVDGSADVVITSPPYFKAIDYIRGHRLALVWLGYGMSRLRHIRSSNVGTQRRMAKEGRVAHPVLDSSVVPRELDDRTQSQLLRYFVDMTKVMQEIRRLLRPGGRVVLVVGSSNIGGQVIDSPALVSSIGESLGLRQVTCIEREIPSNRRYLPPPTSTAQKSLKKRMRTESVMTLEKGDG